MSSILTNNSAMVALQTLKSINANLGQVQGEISTGKSIASAKDNSTVCMTLALDEYARCVWIIAVNSPATSVADSSRA
jgi:Bacterial flagellin N-terminal helical region